jgi:hypothetical protein
MKNKSYSYKFWLALFQKLMFTNICLICNITEPRYRAGAQFRFVDFGPRATAPEVGVSTGPIGD